MLDRGLIDRATGRQLFIEIEGQLYRYPALDPESFRRRVEEALGAG